MAQEMEGTVEPSDAKLTLDKLRDKNFQPWMFGYDTVKQVRSSSWFEKEPLLTFDRQTSSWIVT